MIEYDNLLNLQVMIFILTGIGYLLRKLNIVTTEARAGLTNLVIDVVLPCNIVYSFMIELTDEIIKSSLEIFVVSVVIQLACYGAGYILFKHTSKEEEKVLKYATICSNAGFLGNPLVEGIYGSMGLMYASIYLIPQRICMWSAGVSCFTEAKGKNVVKKVLTHPCILAVMIGMVLMIFKISLPEFATSTIKTISSCTTTLSMIVIGGILAEIELKSVISKLNIYYCLMRLIIIPMIVFAFCYLLKLDHLVTAVATVLSGMPAGATTAILAAKYDGDEKFAVRIVFLSTVLSLITIPLLCMAIEMVLSR